MALDNFFKFSEGVDKEKRMKDTIEKIKKDKKLSEEIAQYKAEEIVFKPDQLEKIRLNASTDVGLRPSLKLYFNNKEELKLVGKYFRVNWNLMEIGDGSLLLRILQALEKQ